MSNESLLNRVIALIEQDIKAAEDKVRRLYKDSDKLQIGYTGNYAISESYSGVIKKDIITTFITSFVGVMLLFLLMFLLHWTEKVYCIFIQMLLEPLDLYLLLIMMED